MSSPDTIDDVPNTLREDELKELGFEDDDEPTQMLLDPRALAKKPSTIVPPRIDEGDVYMLTEQHLRYKAGIVPMDDERVDMRDILRAPPSLPPMAAPLPEPVPAPVVVRANSLSPVAMSTSDTTVPPAAMPVRPRPHPVWPATLAALSVAAVGVFFIRPPASPSASAAGLPEQAPVVMAPAAEPPAPATVPGTVEVPAIEIQASAVPAVAAFVATTNAPLAAQPPAAPAEVPTAAEAPAPEAVAEELPPPAPPPPEAPPFDRSAAASALNSAAGAASSCREPGVPSTPVSVRVTFAPSGAVTIAVVENAPYAGTSVGGCIARTFRSAKAPAFTGTPVTVHKTFQLD